MDAQIKQFLEDNTAYFEVANEGKSVSSYSTHV